MDRTQFRKLLSFAVKENHFVFNGQLFDQIDGVAMGSPLGPSLANIFMSHLEQRYLANCPLSLNLFCIVDMLMILIVYLGIGAILIY